MQHTIRLFLKRYSPHFRETWRLSLPVAIAQIGSILMGLIDNLMIGGLGYVHLSAATLATGLFIIPTIIGIGVAAAIAPLVAEADAAGDAAETGRFLKQGLWVGLGVGVILTVLVFVSAEGMYFLGQPEQEIALAHSFTQLLGLGVIPMMVFLVFKQFSDGLSFTRPAMYITLAGLVCNVCVNWLLIHGNWGFPRLELNGAGIGTLTARILMMALVLVYVFRNERFKKYNLTTGWSRPQAKVIRQILQLGIPSGMQHLFEVGAFAGAAVLIGLMADASASRAAHQIAMQLASLTFMVCTGISAGSAIRVGQSLGRRDYVYMRDAGYAGLMLGAAFMSFAAVCFIAGRHYLPTLFVSEPRVLALAAQLLVIGAFFQMFDGVQAVCVGILRGIQDVKIPTLITFIAYWIIALPGGYLLAFPLGMNVIGIWYGFVASLIFAAVMLTLRFRHLTQQMISTNIAPEPDPYAHPH